MTPKRRIRNVPGSIRQRLLNLSRSRGIRFNAVLQRYAAERFLYRLSASDEVDRFTLKGAALLRVWTGQELRPTRDIDFLARGAPDEGAIRTALRAVCRISCREDGVVFDPTTTLLRAGNAGARCDARSEPTSTGRIASWTSARSRRFLGLVCDSLIAESPFTQTWPAGGPWR